jgi:hypothetical protein
MLDSARLEGPMDSKQIRIVLITILVVPVLWFLSPFLSFLHSPNLPVSYAPLAFDASEAYRLTREFVTQVPTRVFGSLESRQSTGYIRDHLEKLGYSVSYTHFEGRIARRKQVGRNILAYKQGQSSEILVLIAHLDTARTTVQGAMDNGSGVGVLLELARVFAATPSRRSLLMVFSDGAEWGNLGASDLAASYPDRSKIAAVLSLDHVNIGNMEALCLEETGQLKGFSPPWLRQLVRKAIESRYIPVRRHSGFLEYVDRAMLISWTDQGPFLREGLPAINLGSESKDPLRQRTIYHSAQDTIANLNPDSIGAYGRAAESIVRSLDELASIPRQAPDEFLFGGYIRSGIVLTIQIFSFLPLVIALIFYRSKNAGKLTKTGIGRECLAFLATLLPFWVTYFFIELARALRLLPIYTLYPATLKDPVLENPAWGVLAGIFGAALFVAAVCYVIVKFSFRSLPKPDFHVSKLVLLALLLIGIVLSFFYNPYWASLFFTLPAWIWALAGRGQALSTRILNRVLILAAGIVYCAVLWIYASRLGMSWNFVWYQVLALSNGLFTKTGYFLATAIIAIGIRFLAIQSHNGKA